MDSSYASARRAVAARTVDASRYAVGTVGSDLSVLTCRRARNVSLVTFLAAEVGLGLLAVAVFSHTWFDAMIFASGGVVNDTLLVNVLGLTVLCGGAILALGGLRPADVGVRTTLVPRRSPPHSGCGWRSHHQYRRVRWGGSRVTGTGTLSENAHLIGSGAGSIGL